MKSSKRATKIGEIFVLIFHPTNLMVKVEMEHRKIHMLFLYQMIFVENIEVLIQERNMRWKLKNA